MVTFDLQFRLEGARDHATRKRRHSIEKELDCQYDMVSFKLGDRLGFAGSWPDYEVRRRQSEENLSLAMRLSSRDDFHWWAGAVIPA